MKIYNAVVLGAPGSGKTVCMASLYHKLSVPSGAGYFLTAPLAHERLLTNAFSSLLRRGWLAPNQFANIQTYDFTVMVRGFGGANYPAATLRYHDMAGIRQLGYLDAQIAEELDKETDEVLKKADILLALIDGQQLRKHLTEAAVNPEFLLSHVQSLCSQMARHKPKDIPLLFVLTKWDMFDYTDDSLEQAGTSLLEYPAFRELVEDSTGDVRLIPVSSVGRECAKKLDEIRMNDTGDGDPPPLVLKRSELPRPLHIEVPFACILPDILARQRKEVIAAIEVEAKALGRPINPKLTSWEKILGAFGDIAAHVLERLGYDGQLFRHGAHFARRSAYHKSQNAADVESQNQEEARRLREKVNDMDSAIGYILEVMTQTQAAFLKAYPSSDLKARVSGRDPGDNDSPNSPRPLLS